jgi:glucose/arabinose dehydrogenase
MARAQDACARLRTARPGLCVPHAAALQRCVLRRWTHGLCTAVVAAGVLALPGCPSSTGTPPPINVAVGLQAEYLDANVARPYAMAAAADGRVFFTEKNTGLIRVIKDGAILADPFASVPVNFADDRGLLGIALHPDFNVNGRIYVFYTRSDTGQVTSDPRAVIDQRIVYFQAEGGGDVATGEETFVVSLPVGLDTTRIGGVIGFAPDLSLYVGFGDTTDQDAAQIATLPFGKVLRYNDDGTIPANNPTADSAVYAQGLCDPRGLAFDPESHIAFLNDHRAAGSGVWQIDRVLGGKNYGWPAVVGVADSPDELDFVAQHPEYLDPILVSSNDGFAGLAFNPGTKYGSTAREQLFYGRIKEGRITAAPLSADRTVADTPAQFAQNFPAPLTDVTFTPAGTLYVASSSAILRVVTFP